MNISFHLRKISYWWSLLFFVFLGIFLTIELDSIQYDRTTPEITSGELSAHINYLSSDELEGRLSGTIGEKKAAKYLVTQFKKLGVLPGVNQKTYFQEFSFVSGVSLGSKNLLQVTHSLSSAEEVKEKKNFFQLGTDFSPVIFSLKQP